MGGLGMAGADVPRGEGSGDRFKRERSEEDDRRGDEDEDGKRWRGDGDEE